MCLVKGIHHVAMKCPTHESYEAEIAFYGTTLGMEIARSWDGGIMFCTGAGLMEIFDCAEPALPQGVIRHFALATDDVDACVKAVREAGYPITMEPKDIVIGSQPPFPARIAFCTGPLGEEIEFFCKK